MFRRKAEDVLETEPGKITAPSAQHLCEMLGIEATDEHQQEYHPFIFPKPPESFVDVDFRDMTCSC